MKCEACEREQHYNCGLQTWCDCDCDPDDDLPPGPGYCHFCGAETGEPCDEDCECGMCEREAAQKGHP